MSPRYALAILLAAPLLTGSSAPDVPAEPDVSKDAVFDVLGFDSSQRERVLQGEIVTRGFEELSDKELSISLAMLIPVQMDRLLEDLRSGRVLERDRQLLSYGIIHENTVDQDLDRMQFGAGEADEIDGLLGARPGSRFNLDADEFARFDALRRRFPGECAKASECSREVNSEYRRILKDRLKAYRTRGLDGVAPYAREGGKTSTPGRELETAAGGLRPLSERSRQLFRSFAEYPRGDQTLFEHQFVWLKQMVQDRPTMILSHRFLHAEPLLAFLAERQFYVGHSYNSLQIVAGLFPLGGKTLVFYLNRTSTDQVAGLMKATRHSMGRNIMAKEIRAHFEELRKNLGK